jgi:hypothetical protein
MGNDEEVKGGDATHNNENKRKPKPSNDTDDEDDDEDDEKDEIFELNVTLDLVQTPMRKVDEFSAFHQVMESLHKKDPQYINNLVG